MSFATGTGKGENKINSRGYGKESEGESTGAILEGESFETDDH